MEDLVKIVVLGTPISKSNFKLNSKYGKFILPYNSGKYYDRYGVYEEYIAYEIKKQYPNTILNSSLTAILNVYYKYEKKHPDTNNITKSIFDGVEKSGLIVNDSQITKIYIEEFYDKENPRFELTLFENHLYNVTISVNKREIPTEKVTYNQSINSKKSSNLTPTKSKKDDNSIVCCGCDEKILDSDYVKISKSDLILCKKCIKKAI